MKSYFTALLILLALASSSCTKQKQSSVQTQQLNIIEPFQITYTEGGGITGQIYSYEIDSQGFVEHYRILPGQEDSLIWSKNISNNELANLQHSLTSSGILDYSLQDKGNITSTLVYATEDTSYTLTWNGIGAMSNAPQDLKEWLTRLNAIIQEN